MTLVASTKLHILGGKHLNKVSVSFHLGPPFSTLLVKTLMALLHDVVNVVGLVLERLEHYVIVVVLLVVAAAVDGGRGPAAEGGGGGVGLGHVGMHVEALLLLLVVVRVAFESKLMPNRNKARC